MSSAPGADRTVSDEGEDSRPRARGRPVLAVLLLTGTALGVIGAWWHPWFEQAFRLFTRLFHEQWALAGIRFDSQKVLAGWHLGIAAVLAALILGVQGRLSRHVARLAWVLWLAYIIRAGCWVLAGNLPLVPGDSCHYIEVATSIDRGEGPVKHYVESFFRDYRPQGINEGRGVLDDWATPLWSYVLAGVYRAAGVVPGASLEQTFAWAKGTSFLLNLATVLAVYALGRRNVGAPAALGAAALAAVLPVHAIYAAFELRESLVAFLAVSFAIGLCELVQGQGRAGWIWALATGVLGGLAILARDSMLAFVGAAYLVSVLSGGRRGFPRLMLAGLITLVTILPWAWVTYRVYGSPFYSYTGYFAYNFSWTVHHFDVGNTRPEQFFTARNAPEIARVKARAFLIVLVYSTMILSLPVVLGLLGELRGLDSAGTPRARWLVRLVAWIAAGFVLATLVRVADVTQVEQLGRYYLPLFLTLLPSAASGMRAWLEKSVRPAAWGLLLGLVPVLLWADPSWAYDAVWFRRPFQQHWPALVEAGEWIQAHPEPVPPDARIMTWFPWELRVASNRTTILFPRALEAGPYEQRRIVETMERYRVTHVLWGSFETGSDGNPEALGKYLDGLRLSVGLTDDRLIYQTQGRKPFPVRLYRVEPGR